MKFVPPFDRRPHISSEMRDRKSTKIEEVDTCHMCILSQKKREKEGHPSIESAYKGRFFDFSDKQQISGYSGSIRKPAGLKQKRRHRSVYMAYTIFSLSESLYEPVVICRTFLKTNMSRGPLWFRWWRHGNKMKLFLIYPPRQVS